MKIILASKSPQRRLMMDALGLSYEVIPSSLDEAKVLEQDPRKRVVKLAKLKASDISKKNHNAIVIAADTFGFFKDEILEKPKNKTAATKMLKKMSGNWIVALTGVALVKNGRVETELFETIAKFRNLSEKEIKRYVKTQPVTTWSAGFCPGYPEGAALIEKTDGDLTSFLYGLPVAWVASKLEKMKA